MHPFRYARPSSIDEAARLAAADGAVLHGGGTDLLGLIRDEVVLPETVVSLQGLDGLRTIRRAPDGGLRIGALVTIAELAADETVRSDFTALADAAEVVASPQLRNQGTLGGNLCQKPRCWYYRGDFDCLRKGGDTCFALGGQNQFHCIFGGDACVIVHPSDPAPALIALGAAVKTRRPRGEGRTIAVADLHVPPSDDPTRETYLEPGETITEVLVPAPRPGLRSSYRKIRARATWDFALAGVALALAFEGDTVREASVVLSGVAPVPWRSEAVEKAVVGRRLDTPTIAAAAEAAVEGAEPLEHNGYKVPLLRGVVKQQLEALAAS